MVTVRSIVSFAASRQWHIHHMDIFNAFLQGDLEDEIYMQLPQGFVSQGEKRKYTLELIDEVGMSAAKPTGTPIDVNVKLTSKQYNEQMKNKKTPKDQLVDQTTYQKLIGKLLYMNMTRPDISFSTQTLSQFLQQPKKSHMDVALRVVRYLKRQPGHGVLLTSSSDEVVTAFCDADWAF
ncbi:uncharacterized mitochondrial protein AtMg00810-like [Solanum tuberosum]|uniref:uncharacterized mitochondrial protein AtMg00810-like n=1 Tax=Solanum tuberosum TaxID=4113 RepID=UPI00073A1514|nr:PREDICTED: uncharacterized mitochondrial protein AtMg00810-like [Solanum tuberosum]